MKTNWLIYVILSTFGVMTTAYAAPKQDNTKFLNGKPFAHLYELTQENADAIASLQEVTSDLRTDLGEMEAQIVKNAEDIEALSSLEEQMKAIEQAVGEHLSEMRNTVNALRIDMETNHLAITELMLEMANLSADASQLRSDFDSHYHTFKDSYDPSVTYLHCHSSWWGSCRSWHEHVEESYYDDSTSTAQF